MRDRAVLYATAFVRALATGFIGVLLGIYLGRLGHGAREIGLVIGAGLSGAAASAVAVSFLADRYGRRRTLLTLSAASVAGGAALAVGDSVPAMCAAAFVGMVNGMGRDRGAQLVLEQAILSGTTADAQRTRAFAWYNVLQDAGHALGGGLAALPAMLRTVPGVSEPSSFRAAIGAYALLLAVTALLYLRLTPAVEARVTAGAAETSRGSRKVIWKISSLFALDSVAGGFLGTAILAYFFYMRFGVSEAAVAALFAAARVANAASHLASAWLARRIGLVNTMVFTHIPSSVFLLVVPFVPYFGMAASLFLLRELLVEMDVPTRQSYVMAIVQPHERTFAAGITHLVRLGGWAVAPFFAGILMQGLTLAAPLYIGSCLKIVYDLALFRAFHHLKPPEERPVRG